MIILIPPTNKQGTQFKWPDENKYPVSSNLNAESLAAYFNKHLTGLKVPFPESATGSYMNYILLIIVAVSILKNFYQYRYDKNFWLSACTLMIWFTYTGTIWNINRGAPFILGGQSISIIWPQQRTQTVLEGLIVATLLIVVGAVFVFVGVYVPRLKREADQRYYFYLGSTVFALVYLVLHVIWLRKTPWYLVYSQ